MLRRTLLAAGVAAGNHRSAARAEDAGVDVALVLAVDVSRSVDEEEARLQREGYRAAVVDPRVLEAIRGGMVGAVALAYVEWAGIDYQRTLIPWTRVGDAGEAAAWAETLASAPRQSLSWTSISGGIEAARRELAALPYETLRRVIDVSGDGPNNSGPPVEEARDRAVAEGITINGLPIVNDRPGFGRRPSIPLDEYYERSVIGGPGAFVVVAEDFASFGDAVRRKLVREIAGGGTGPAVTRRWG